MADQKPAGDKKAPTSMVGDAEPILNPDREKLYESYEKAQEGGLLGDQAQKKGTDKSEFEPPTDSQPEDGKTDDPADKEDASTEDDKNAEETGDTSDNGEKKEGEDDKMVPYAALHAEREKRKETQVKVKELESQVQVLLKDMKELMTKKKEEGKEPEKIEDYDKELLDLRKKVSDLEAEKKAREIKSQEDEKTRAANEHKRQVQETSAALEKDGFPGFERFKSLVRDELIDLIQADPENKKLDTPEGWQKIYKEKVFPTISSIFKTKSKEDKLAEKRKLKEEANLAGKSGSDAGGSKDEKSDDDWSYDDYIRERRKSSMVSS